ncbi:hypothetical protein [Haloferula sp.]|uniref:hypothetical protein n=1 Tax=Haloferula sp. TaxID=2497595 RepID=UPI003C73282D
MKSTLRIVLFLGLLPLQAYDLHEWGTFTTVSGSDGKLLIGLHREEEHLPSYVFHHPGFNQPPRTNVYPFAISAKRMPIPVTNVKVKMETPVIYFHSREAFSAKVEVEFEGGTIAQWYPERSGGEVVTTPNPSILPKPDLPKFLDFAKPYTGSIEWQIDVLSPSASKETTLFHPDDLLQWTYARVPEANVVRAKNGSHEGFLFYRGLGSFDPGLVTRVTDDETLHLENQTGGRIPYTLVYERFPDGSSRWCESGGLSQQSTSSIPESSLKVRSAGFDAELFETLRDKLAAQGLLKSEAEAMVKTWWNSYFEKPGLRVFWILPGEKIDAILPLTVEPAPEKTVRVMVGRSEILRPKQERDWLAMASSTEKEEASKWIWITSGDRFGLAYAQRIEMLRAQAKR